MRDCPKNARSVRSLFNPTRRKHWSKKTVGGKSHPRRGFWFPFLPFGKKGVQGITN